MHEPHTHKSYDAELSRLGQELETMGEAAAQQLEAALVALEQRDDAAAELRASIAVRAVSQTLQADMDA